MNIKQIISFAMLAVLSACGNGEQSEYKDMNTLTFTEQQAAAITVIACNEAKGDQSSLTNAINEGFDANLTANQIKEALSQLYAYTGFPRSLNALGTLQKVMEQRQDVTTGAESSQMPSDYDALKQGTEVQTKLSGQPFNYEFCPAEDYYLKAHLFGDIFARDILTHADRELVTVSALSGLENVMPQLIAHVKGAKNMGVTEAQLQGIATSLRNHGLEAEAQRCEAAIASVNGNKTPVISPSAWPLGNPNTAYAQYFIGNSYLAVLDNGLCNVTFEPGCRNNWHVHHGAVQVLICVYGHGWYQEWGKPAVELKEGVVIEVPEGVKHWHGAAKNSWMQHLTYHADLKPDNSNELVEQRGQNHADNGFAESRHKSSETQWLEAVSDEEYNKLK